MHIGGPMRLKSNYAAAHKIPGKTVRSQGIRKNYIKFNVGII